MIFANVNTDNHQDELREFKRVQDGMKHIETFCKSVEEGPAPIYYYRHTLGGLLPSLVPSI